MNTDIQTQNDTDIQTQHNTDIQAKYMNTDIQTQNNTNIQVKNDTDIKIHNIQIQNTQYNTDKQIYKIYRKYRYTNTEHSD